MFHLYTMTRNCTEQHASHSIFIKGYRPLSLFRCLQSNRSNRHSKRRRLTSICIYSDNNNMYIYYKDDSRHQMTQIYFLSAHEYTIYVSYCTYTTWICNMQVFILYYIILFLGGKTETMITGLLFLVCICIYVYNYITKDTEKL